MAIGEEGTAVSFVDPSSGAQRKFKSKLKQTFHIVSLNPDVACTIRETIWQYFSFLAKAYI